MSKPKSATPLTPPDLVDWTGVALQRNEYEPDRFLTHMVTRNIRIEEDLIDQLFKSREKRLAGSHAAATRAVR
jgi:hypothetical protein